MMPGCTGRAAAADAHAPLDPYLILTESCAFDPSYTWGSWASFATRRFSSGPYRPCSPARVSNRCRPGCPSTATTLCFLLNPKAPAGHLPPPPTRHRRRESPSPCCRLFRARPYPAQDPHPRPRDLHGNEQSANSRTRHLLVLRGFGGRDHRRSASGAVARPQFNTTAAARRGRPSSREHPVSPGSGDPTTSG